MGVPLVIIHLYMFFSYKLFILGTPFLETPIYHQKTSRLCFTMVPAGQIGDSPAV
jgi:hypothetical protein